MVTRTEGDEPEHQPSSDAENGGKPMTEEKAKKNRDEDPPA